MSKYLGGLAAEVYGQTSGGRDIQSFIPRSKFQFNVTITFLDATGSVQMLSSIYDSQMNPLPLRISGVTMPTHSARVQTLNQYNKKRIVQTGVDYSPIELSVYDTRDAQIEAFLRSYNEYYYDGVMTADGTRTFNDISTDEFTGGPDSGYGFDTKEDRNFIKTIQITRSSSVDDVSITTIYNPVITSFSYDRLDYGDSNPMLINIQFAYESYNTISSSYTPKVSPSPTPEPPLPPTAPPPPTTNEDGLRRVARQLHINKSLPFGPALEFDKATGDYFVYTNKMDRVENAKNVGGEMYDRLYSRDVP